MLLFLTRISSVLIKSLKRFPSGLFLKSFTNSNALESACSLVNFEFTYSSISVKSKSPEPFLFNSSNTARPKVLSVSEVKVSSLSLVRNSLALFSNLKSFFFLAFSPLLLQTSKALRCHLPFSPHSKDLCSPKITSFPFMFKVVF